MSAVRPRRRLALAVLVAVAVVAAAAVAAVLVLGTKDQPEPGPLAADTDVRLAIGRRAGAPFTYAQPVVFNRGDRPAVLERISLVDASPGLAVIGTRVAGSGRELLSLSGEPRWPPRELRDLHPVRGYEVPPDGAAGDGPRGVELVFGLRAERLGIHRVAGVRVDYRVGDERHRDVIRFRYVVCAVGPGRPLESACPDDV